MIRLIMPSVRKRTVVKPGGLVEVSAGDLPAGTAVDVWVEPAADTLPPVDLRKIVGSAKGLFSSPEEVDAYISSLRDEWES
jgi:hypothetical protein